LAIGSPALAKTCTYTFGMGNGAPRSAWRQVRDLPEFENRRQAGLAATAVIEPTASRPPARAVSCVTPYPPKSCSPYVLLIRAVGYIAAMSRPPHSDHRFTLPWTVHYSEGAYWVQDASGMKFGYVYYREPPYVGAGLPEKLSEDEARRLATQFARLPQLLNRS
jgi:hypothetical protein